MPSPLLSPHFSSRRLAKSERWMFECTRNPRYFVASTSAKLPFQEPPVMGNEEAIDQDDPFRRELSTTALGENTDDTYARLIA